MGDFDFVIKLKDKTTLSNISSLKEHLEANQFKTYVFPANKAEVDISKGQRMILVKYEEFSLLLQKAEDLKLQKRMLDQYLQADWFNSEEAAKPTGKEETEESEEQAKKYEKEEEFRSDKMKQFIKIKPLLPGAVNRMENYRKFRYEDRHKFSRYTDDQQIFEKLFTPSEQLMIKRAILENIETEEGNMIDIYREKELIHNIVPLHQRLQKPQTMDTGEIRKYFGDNISIYFEFVEFFQRQLIPLVVIGFLFGFLNQFFGFNSKTSPFDSLYSAIVIFWATYFYANWRKFEKQQEILSCSHSSKMLKKTNKMIVSQKDASNFAEKINYVTGQRDHHFPTKKRIIKYIKSAIQLLPFISLAIIFLIVSLNCRGYVDPSHEFLYIEKLFAMSQEGGFFDKKIGYRKILATILHVNIFQKLNSFYRERAETSSKQELHSTQVKKNNSIILKRFLFEMLYTFTDLSYIAFVRFDIEALKSELIAIYSVDEVRRVMTESIVPYFTKLKLRKQQEKERELQQKKSDEQQQVMLNYFEDLLLELQLPKYEPFDDYLEIVINFGYITLFAAAFPYAPLLVYFFNAIELFSDKRKIYYLYQRPAPFKISGIGIWNEIINFMAILCVITNIILFSFSSDQIAEFFPQAFHKYGPKQTQGKGKYLVLIVFIIEHCLFIGIYLLKKYVKSKEDWTSIYTQRKEYYKKIRFISHNTEND